MYRPNKCKTEPAIAFKVDGRGCLNKHQPPILGNYWHFACPDGLWNALARLGTLYLLTTHLSFFIDDAPGTQRDLLPMACLRVVQNIDSFDKELSTI